MFSLSKKDLSNIKFSSTDIFDIIGQSYPTKAAFEF